MYVDFSIIKDTLIIKLSGELDHHSAELVRTKIDDRIERENLNKIIFNFQSVMFMDSSGIGVILGRYRKIKALGGTICLVNVNDRVNKVFELSGVYKIINVYDSVDEAICNF